MLRFFLRRFILMFFTLVAISIISFIIIQAPPGDFTTFYIARIQTQRGERLDPAEIAAMKVLHGTDSPMYIKYFKWLGGIVRGDFGRSLEWGRPVGSLIAERLPGSLTISFASFIFVYLIAIPIGVFSATHQYSISDYIFTFLGFLGLAIPNFFFALVLLWVYFVYTGEISVGLFSEQYLMASWSFAKFVDLLKHLWMPAIVVGTAGTAGLIRVVRANLLDELPKPYVMVARSKGLSETKTLYKYPFRIAANPIISTIGWTLPALVSGEILVSLVLNIPTIGPLLLNAVMTQDMFLASSIVFILSTLTVIGTLISDILLTWVDPRIRESI